MDSPGINCIFFYSGLLTAGPEIAEIFSSVLFSSMTRILRLFLLHFIDSFIFVVVVLSTRALPLNSHGDILSGQTTPSKCTLHYFHTYNYVLQI